MGKTTVTTKSVEERDGDEDLGGESLPLISSTDAKSQKVAKVGVRRTDPDEGHLGFLNPDATEADILERWGGGEFRLEFKNETGRIISGGGGVRTIKLAGDPIFQSEIAEARWRRSMGLGPKQQQQRNGGDGLSVRDVLVMLKEEDAKRREETLERERTFRAEALEREERMRREQREHEEKLAKAEAEREDRRRKDAADREERQRKDDADREERRRRQAQEDDERRARQHREDLDRMAQQQAAQIQQTQAFFQQLVAMKDKGAGGEGGGGIKALLTGIEVAAKLGRGGGEEGEGSLVNTIFDRLPETLREARETATHIYHEVTGKGGGAAGGEEVRITGPTAGKVKALILHLKKQGKDPEKVIDQVASYLMATPAQRRQVNGRVGGGGTQSSGAAPAAAAAARPSSSTRSAPAHRAAARRPAAPKRRGRVVRRFVAKK